MSLYIRQRDLHAIDHLRLWWKRRGDFAQLHVQLPFTPTLCNPITLLRILLPPNDIVCSFVAFKWKCGTRKEATKWKTLCSLLETRLWLWMRGGLDFMLRLIRSCATCVLWKILLCINLGFVVGSLIMWKQLQNNAPYKWFSISKPSSKDGDACECYI